MAVANSNYWRTVALALFLGVATFLLFAPAIGYDFVSLDDDVYVYNNPVVQQGFTVSGFRWAWAGAYHSYWLPLLWISYLVDTQLFGRGPSGYHFTNVLLHALNTALLFLLLARTTGHRWPSFAAAALFGWHPLRVESVAWITERKDVLSTLFGLLALWAYCRYAALPGAGLKFLSRVGRNQWHGVALACFILGLMSKPMLVSLPVVLLLLDFWPLRRLEFPIFNSQRSTSLRLIGEKWPWWILAAVFSGITYVTQSKTGAVIPWAKVTLGERLGEVPLAYGFYLVKTIWPRHLAAVYPGLRFGLGGFVLALAALAGLTVVVVRARRRHAALLVGWLWFVVTLLPVIGLVRVGVVQVADRFTYLPSIGLSIMCVWGLASLVSGWRYPKAVLVCSAVVALAGCGTATWFQVRHWRNSLTLLHHALTVTGNNALAHYDLGVVLFKLGRVPDAVRHFDEAVRLNPGYARAHGNLGAALLHQGKLPEAIEHLRQSLRLMPGDAEAHNNLAAALFQAGNVAEAIGHLEEALRLKPDYPVAHYSLGLALLRAGKVSEAIEHLERTLSLSPRDAEAHLNLGVSLSRQGRVAEAVAHYQQALEIDPRLVAAQRNLAWLLATCADGSVRDGARAVAVAKGANQLTGGKDAAMLDILAAAYAEAGLYGEAARTAQAALLLLAPSGPSDLATAIQARLQFYQAGRPYHEGPSVAR